MNDAPSKVSVTDRLAALGEMIRLRILRLLEREELSVGEVAKVVQLPQSTVSRHLKILADAHWLAKRSEGTAALYRLVLDDLPQSSRSLWLAVREQLGGGQGEGPTAELAEDIRRLASVLADRREDSQGFFGRVAGQWDDVRAELFGQRFTRDAMLALLPSNWTVVDLGCGTGNVSELLAPVVQRVIAVDRSGPMLAAAKKRLASVSNVEFVEGDVSSIPLAASSADAVVCMLVLHHVESPPEAFFEAARILKPGGQLLVVDMVEHDRTTYKHTMGHRWLGFSRVRMEGFATASGLQRPRFQPLVSETQGKGPGLFAFTAHKPMKTI